MIDVVLNKKESIERCVRQIRLYYGMTSSVPFEEDFVKQDAIAANLQRAAEQIIDLANHVIRKQKLGLPKESKESFAILAKAGIISDDLARKMAGMVGFRNILVHEYQEVNMDIFRDVIEHRLDDLIDFTVHVMEYVRGNPA